MATMLTTLPDFIVNIDRAGHLVIDQVSAVGTVIKSIDFGTGRRANIVVGAWLDLDDVSRDLLDPAINAYLLAYFATR